MTLDLDRLDRELRNGVLQLLLLGTIQRQGPIHGYGIIQSMERATQMQGGWKEGTIYPILASLDRSGVLRSRWGEGPGARRKYYELTPSGERSLAAATARWERIRDAVGAALEIA